MNRKTEKSAVLIVIVLIMMSSMIYVTPDWNIVGLCKDSGILQRIVYSFFHVSVTHALLNSWCLVSIVFIHDISWKNLITAYVIAVSAPTFVLSITPTVGLSAVCFALLGIISIKARQKLYYNICISVYIILGLLLPGVNGWLHLYSYMAGLLVGLLNMPVTCR